MPKRLTPKEYQAQQKQIIDEMLSGAQNVQTELRHLTSSEGWSYVVGIAHGILKDFECTPKAPAEDWQKYTQMKWALDKLIGTVNKLAVEPIPEPTKAGPPNANIGRKPRQFNTSPDSPGRIKRR